MKHLVNFFLYLIFVTVLTGTFTFSLEHGAIYIATIFSVSVISFFFYITFLRGKKTRKTRGFEVVASQHRKHPNGDIRLPRRSDAGACASDVYSPIALTLQPGEKQLIWTDIKAYMQQGEVCLANVRSNYGKVLVRLANTQGWIDQTYHNNPSNDGNIGIYLSNEGNETFEINVGDRIAQLMFIPYLVPDNDNPIQAKRRGGFGSSGK